MSGSVVNQHGDPIEGATVEVWGVDYTQISAGDLESKKDKALQEIEDAATKTPDEWTNQVESNFQLTGSSGHFADSSGKYVAVHEPNDWQASVFSANILDDPTLSNPMMSIPAAKGEEVEIAVSVWDATQEEGFLGGDGVKEDLPGQPVDGQVRLESILGGDDISTTYTRTTEIGAGGIVAATDYSNAYHTVTVTPGIYRVHPEENDASSYYIKIGDPVSYIGQNLTNQDGQVADQASQVAQDLTDGKFTRATATTGSDGNWSVSVGSDVNTVAVQARKIPDNAPSDMDPSSMESIIDTFETNETDLGSLYLSTSPKRIDPPQTNVTMEMYEFSYPPSGNLSTLANKSLEDYWERFNDTRNDIDDMWQDRLDDINASYEDDIESLYDRLNETQRERLEDMRKMYNRLYNLSQQNEELQNRYEELLEEHENVSDPDANFNESKFGEMEDRIELLQQTISELEEQIESGPVEKEIGQDTISMSFPFGTDLSADQVTVLAHFSNGTTETLTPDSEYVSIDSGLAGPLSGDTVNIEEYPLGENDAASVSFEVLVANEDGIGRSTESVVNPTYAGTVPELESVRFSTLHPGPSESITVELNPENPSQFGSLVSLTAHHGADEITTDNVSGLTSGFDTSGSGVYHVEMVFNDTDGNQFTEVVRLEAGSVDDKYPPTMIASSGPTGDYAVVGDGLQSGEIDVQDGGSTVSVSAVIQDSADNPGQVDIYLDSIDTAPNVVTEFSIVRGDRKEGVSSRTGVMMHIDSLTENAVIYRDENSPIPRSGATQYGRVDVRQNGTTLETFTGSDGTVSVEVMNNPGIIDRVFYRARLELSQLNVPVLGFLSPVQGVGA